MIPFKYGTQEQYDAQVKDNSALYFISDTKRIYRGEELIAGVQALVVSTLPSFNSAVEGIIYVLLDGNNASLYIKGDTEIVPLSAEVSEGSIDSVDVFTEDMLITSADDIEDADDNKLITAGAAVSAIQKATGTWEYLDGSEDTSRIYG